MPDPFEFTEEDKIVIVLARVLYLKNVAHKRERPNPDPLHTGSPVFRSTARTVVALLGYGDDTLDDLVAEAEALYQTATKEYETSTAA